MRNKQYKRSRAAIAIAMLGGVSVLLLAVSSPLPRTFLRLYNHPDYNRYFSAANSCQIVTIGNNPNCVQSISGDLNIFMPACTIDFNGKKAKVGYTTGASVTFSSFTCRKNSKNSWFEADISEMQGVVTRELQFVLYDFAEPWLLCFEESDQQQPLVNCSFPVVNYDYNDLEIYYEL